MSRLKVLIVLLLFCEVLSNTNLQMNCGIMISGKATTCVNSDLEVYKVLTKISSIGFDGSQRVTSIMLTSDYMFYMPNNIFSFFLNVKEVAIMTALPQLIILTSGQFKGLTNLKKLQIAGQRIRFLGANTFQGAPAITHLFIPSNQIESIHEEAFAGLTECRFLQLSHNRITSIEGKTFAHMTKLWSINLSKNRLKSLTEKLFINNKLTVLDLGFNNLESIPKNVAENFNAVTDEMKLLSVIGNVCDDRIYLKDSRNVMATMKKCFNKINPNPKYSGSDEELEMVNQELRLENSRLKKEIKRLTASGGCSLQKCHSVVGDAYKELLDIVKNVLPLIVKWKEEIEKLLSIIDKMNRSQNTSSDRPIIDAVYKTGSGLKDSSDSGVSNGSKGGSSAVQVHSEGDGSTISGIIGGVESGAKLEKEITSIKITINSLTDKNKKLVHNVDKLMSYINGKLILSENSEKPTKPHLVTLSNETSPTSNCGNEIKKLKDQLVLANTNGCDGAADEISVSEVQQPNKKEADDSDCLKSMKVKELNKTISSLKEKIAEKEILLADMSEGVKMYSIEAAANDKKKQETAKKIFDLEEEVADCNTLRNIDAISATSNEVEDQIMKKDSELELVYEALRRSADENAIVDSAAFNDEIESFRAMRSMRRSSPRLFLGRSSSKNNLKNFIVSKTKETTSNLSAKDVSEMINELIFNLKKRYEELHDGDERIDETLNEMSKLVQHSLSRRGLSDIIKKPALDGEDEDKENDKDLIFNESLNIIGDEFIDEDVISKVDDVNLVVINQNRLLQLLEHEMQDFLKQFSKEIDDSPLKSILASVQTELGSLKRSVNSKDDILKLKYQFVEESTDRIEVARNEAIKSKHQLEKTRQEHSELPELNDGDVLNDVADFVEEKNRNFVDKANEEMEQMIGEHLEKIAMLSDEVEDKDEKIQEVTKTHQDLLKKCHSCRSVWNKFTGKVKKWMFSKKSDCDFI